jgi:hypothetical protein
MTTAAARCRNSRWDAKQRNIAVAAAAGAHP